LEGFQASRLVVPPGTSRAYNTRTISFFPDWKSVGGSSRYSELPPKVHPGKNALEILERIAALQEIVTVELFEV